jgi:hypothetical protein
MSNSRRNLWPEDIAVTDAVAPVTILKEQATLLGQRTQNLVEARVAHGPIPFGVEAPFRYHFRLVAPVLDYQFQLFTISHGLKFYPLSVEFDDLTYAVANEEEFMQYLASIFSSEKTKSIISSLIAQSKAA